MKAVYLDYASLDQQDLDFQALHGVFDELTLYPATSVAELLPRVQDVDVIITNKVMVNAEIIQQCPQLKLILISATGTNNVDLAAAKARNIVVCNCCLWHFRCRPTYLMLMLNLATSFLPYQQNYNKANGKKATQFCLLDAPIVELSGKTLGIVGYGELG